MAAKIKLLESLETMFNKEEISNNIYTFVRTTIDIIKVFYTDMDQVVKKIVPVNAEMIATLYKKAKSLVEKSGVDQITSQEFFRELTGN